MFVLHDALCCFQERNWSVLIVILSANFINLLEIILLFCCAALYNLRRMRMLVFFFLFLLTEILLLVIYLVLSRSGFGIFAFSIRSGLGERRSTRSLCIGRRLCLALLRSGRSFYYPSVSDPSLESIIHVCKELTGGEINPA